MNITDEEVSRIQQRKFIEKILTGKSKLCTKAFEQRLAYVKNVTGKEFFETETLVIMLMVIEGEIARGEIK